ncbi:YbaK/EbsC family protein [Pectobacterium actinidiae]|uniref:YbaK/EbsC family protein n=1 Tax=Pectobacterium actinidiae TaxID=1507808 RepID=A0ABW8G6L3_9GAMM
MSVDKVKKFLRLHAPDVQVVELEKSTATVSDAAKAFGVESGQIAKSLTFTVGEDVVLLVLPGDRRLDNKKYKNFFGVKARMLPADEVEYRTGFKPGGVSPLGVSAEVKVYCDVGLRQYDEVLPAGGSGQSGVRITPDRLADITMAEWVDMSSL